MNLRNVPVAILAAALASCETSRWYNMSFAPAPHEVKIESEHVPGSQVRALVSVLGIARGGETAPDAAIVRMKLENLGSGPVQLQKDRLELVSADIITFGKP